MIWLKFPPPRLVRTIEVVRHQLAWLRLRMVPPPAAMIEMIFDAWAAQAIVAAAELGLADALAKGPLSADELAAAVDANADALSRLLRALSARGIFRQRGDGRYDLTPLANTLRSDAEASMAGMARWVGALEHREHWSRLPDAIRRGHAIIPEFRGKPFFDYLAGEPELSEIYNRAMTKTSELLIAPVIAAYDFSRYATIVDVGGGQGRFLAAILAAAPNACGVLFDQPQVVAGAPALLSEHRVADRVRIARGSFFDDDIPTDGDAYVLKNIIHDWPDDDAVRILSNVHAAAGAGKNVLLVELVLPRHDRDVAVNWIDIDMLLAVSGRERTAAEYGRLLDRAGFHLTRVVETATPFKIVEARAI
jgi:O-methyltransferase domain/Dimerisation domain